MKALIGLIAAVAVVGGGYYVYTTQMSSSSDSTRLMEGATATDPNSVDQMDGHAMGETATGSWKDLMGMSGAHKCTVGMMASGIESVGTVYLSGGKMRADFTTTMEGKPVDSHVIATAEANYSWMSTFPQGVKTPGVNIADTKATTQGGFDPNVEVNYSCTPWTVDSTMFSPPTNIEFMDSGAMMQGMMK